MGNLNIAIDKLYVHYKTNYLKRARRQHKQTKEMM